MNVGTGLASAALALAPFSAAFAQAAPTEEELLRRLEEAEQKIRILERKLENQAEAQATATASAPQVRATGTRFSIGTPDGVVRQPCNISAEGAVGGSWNQLVPQPEREMAARL